MVKEEKTDRGDVCEQSGNLGIGDLSGGEIKGEAKVAGVIHEAPSPKLEINSLDGCATVAHTVNHHYYSDRNSEKGLANPSSHCLDEDREYSVSRLGAVTCEDHKYEGQLVSMGLDFFQDISIERDREIGIILDISFGEVEETFSYRKGLVGESVEGYVRFGIKHGKLHVHLQNGAIPLKQRIFLEDSKGDWAINATGVKESPTWEFKARSQKSKSLSGSRVNQKLGRIDCLSNGCVVTATFKVRVNGNDLEITAQDGVWNSETKPAVRETKIRAFFKKVLEPKLKDYLSKVILEHDSAVTS